MSVSVSLTSPARTMGTVRSSATWFFPDFMHQGIVSDFAFGSENVVMPMAVEGY